ncbi:FtsQ-type POTRA domain-containing protein [bacterium]|nr:FtsQ-type POTRA domain-containing protein [bacterium]
MNNDSTAKLGFFARIGRGFSILLILGVFAAIALAVVLYLRGERFDLRRTAIEGNAVVSDEEIKKLLPLGENLFDIDTDELETELGQHPYLSAAVVEKQYPDKLLVVVSERTPALWLAEGPLQLLAGDGTALPKQLDESGGGFDLPVLTGYEIERVAPLERYDDPAILAACRLCSEMQHQALPFFDELVELQIRRNHLRGVLASGAVIRFAEQTDPAVLTALQAAYNRELNEGFNEMDTRYAGQIVAR